MSIPVGQKLDYIQPMDITLYMTIIEEEDKKVASEKGAESPEPLEKIKKE